ncbi:MAG: hypothetical protein LBC47_09595 [Tannerella sp.]|jgi:hypothetical protein|nr:hypothetical protein [Tannerella sp.]
MYEYVNDLIAMGTQTGKDFYKVMVTANGMVHDFYERIKTATKSSIVYRTFITGISPVVPDKRPSESERRIAYLRTSAISPGANEESYPQGFP